MIKINNEEIKKSKRSFQQEHREHREPLTLRGICTMRFARRFHGAPARHFTSIAQALEARRVFLVSG